MKIVILSYMKYKIEYFPPNKYLLPYACSFNRTTGIGNMNAFKKFDPFCFFREI